MMKLDLQRKIEESSIDLNNSKIIKHRFAILYKESMFITFHEILIKMDLTKSIVYTFYKRTMGEINNPSKKKQK